MFPLLPEKSRSDFLETAGSALPQWVHTGWGMCLAATTLNPPKLMWTVLIVSLEARHCKNASGNSSKNKEPTALTRPPNFADPNPITIYGMRLNKPIQRRLHPEIHRTQRICCQSLVPDTTGHPPELSCSFPDGSKLFFLFFFCGMRGRDIIVITFIFIA